MADIMGCSSGIQSYGNDEKSFDDGGHDVMAAAAIILNQSNESCCCSDDEFTLKAVNSEKDLEFEEIDVSNKKSNKNLKKLQYNALTESIQAN